MAIQKYQDSFSDPVSASFSTMLDRFFNDSLASRGRVNSFSPQTDAYETEQGYQIEVALPGMKREDVKVDFHQGRLTVSGERSFRNEQSQRRYHVVESSYGSFQRSFQLPDTVDPSRIEATLEDGVLHVLVPKDEQKTMRHQIQVRGSQAGSESNKGGSNGSSGRSGNGQSKGNNQSKDAEQPNEAGTTAQVDSGSSGSRKAS